MAYAKLSTNILFSTVWTESPEFIKVWIALMALADRDGYVGASVEGLARAVILPEETCQKALDRFLSPDLKSRTKEFQGRRIIEVDGGWKLLNYAKYRDQQSKQEQDEAHARRQREYIARKKAKEDAERQALWDAEGESALGHRELLGMTAKAGS